LPTEALVTLAIDPDRRGERMERDVDVDVGGGPVAELRGGAGADPLHDRRALSGQAPLAHGAETVVGDRTHLEMSVDHLVLRPFGP
jgi:hypothetical protein